MTDRKPKSTDTAARIKANDVELQKQEQTSTDVGNQEERTPTATELAADHPEIFGEETSTSEDSTDEQKSPQDRQVETSFLTSDQRSAAMEGEPKNQPSEAAGVELGDRVMLYTSSPIGGQVANPAHVIGFSPVTGNPNLRLELTDGGRARPVEFGNVPKDEAIEERGAYFRLPADIKEEGEKAIAKK